MILMPHGEFYSVVFAGLYVCMSPSAFQTIVLLNDILFIGHAI